ncbi:MAG: GTP cyclohydrolase I FolE [Lachnospiraceae bacterium]|nr:GTP cyclohydrolase I FolE [Lachnospiraceae bacterium]
MVDQEKVQAAVRMLLEGIGEDPDREGLKDTPERIGRMYAEILAGMDMQPGEILSRTFSSDNTEIVLEKDIPFYSMCEHHMLPFFGKAHVAYIPDGGVVGLSKLARCVELYARRLQLQERMTDQIADAVMNELGCKGVFVMTEAEHTCMTMRGVKKPGSKTVSMAKRGAFAQDQSLMQTVFEMMR